jgi:hypothetical protein
MVPHSNAGSTWIRVIHDRVRAVLWSLQLEVEALPRHVARRVPAAGRFLGAEQLAVARGGPAHRLVERGSHEDAEVPHVSQLAVQQEDAVEQKDRVSRRGFEGAFDRLVRPEVEDASPDPAVAAGSERFEQDTSQRGVVE